MTQPPTFAKQTLDAQTAYESQLCAFFKAKRRPKSAGKMSVSPRGAMLAALDRYDVALAREVAATRASSPDLHPAPMAHNVADRARLLARGTARLAAGIPLSIVWAAAGQCLLPEMARAQLGHFALHTCCAGGATDLKRANEKAAGGLSAKRDYQRKQAEHRAWLAGTFGPLDPARDPSEPSSEFIVDTGPSPN